MAEKYAGADWLEESCKIKMSPFGRKVADILGQVWRGIYHLDYHGSLHKVDWMDDRFIRITITGELATFDSQHLTELVVAAHDCCIRVSIGACNMQRIALEFSRRTARDGNLYLRHPTIEQAVASWREHLALPVGAAGVLPTDGLKVFGQLVDKGPTPPRVLYTCRSIDVKTAEEMLSFQAADLARKAGAPLPDTVIYILTGDDGRTIGGGEADFLRTEAR